MCHKIHNESFSQHLKLSVLSDVPVHYEHSAATICGSVFVHIFSASMPCLLLDLCSIWVLALLFMLVFVLTWMIGGPITYVFGPLLCVGSLLGWHGGHVGRNELGTLPVSQICWAGSWHLKTWHNNRVTHRGREVATRRCATTLPCESNDSELWDFTSN